MDISPNHTHKEQLVNDFKVVLADTEALLKATADHGGEIISKVRIKAEKSLSVARARMAEAQFAVVDKSKEAAKVTDVYVHDHPWKLIGTAAAVGVVIALIIDRS